MAEHSGKYANKKKSGSKEPMNYDPKTTYTSGSGSGPGSAGMYSPSGDNTPSAPSAAKNNG